MGKRPLNGPKAWTAAAMVPFIPIPGKQVRAHRYAYQTQVGEIPDGHDVCHRCDVKMRDMEAKGYRNTRCKLRPEQKLEARRLRYTEGFALRKVASMLGVSETTIRRAVT